MSTKSRFIRAQGELDGGCFLYSLVNAVQCLTNTTLTLRSWSKLVAAVHDTRDYLDGRIGTLKTDENSNLQQLLAQQYIDILSPKDKLVAKVIEPIGRNSNLIQYLTPHSLLVMANDEHWFCLLDIERHQAYVACSWVLQEKCNAYLEETTPRLRRISNDNFRASDLVFFRNRAIQVKKSKR